MAPNMEGGVEAWPGCGLWCSCPSSCAGGPQGEGFAPKGHRPVGCDALILGLGNRRRRHDEALVLMTSAATVTFWMHGVEN